MCEPDYAHYLCFAPKHMDGAPAKKKRFRVAPPRFGTKLQSFAINPSRTYRRTDPGRNSFSGEASCHSEGEASCHSEGEARRIFFITEVFCLQAVWFTPDLPALYASRITLTTFVLHRNIWTALPRKKSAFASRRHVSAQNCSRSLSIPLAHTTGQIRAGTASLTQPSVILRAKSIVILRAKPEESFDLIFPQK